MQTSGSLRHARGLTQRSLLHSTQTRSASRLGGKRKLGAPLRQNFPTYEISPLILDLEAEGSPYVRPYDDGDEAQQSALWAQRPKVDALRARIADFKRELDDSQARMKAVANDVFSPARLSDVDILSVALLGARPQATGQDSVGITAASSLSRVLEKNGVFHRFTQDRAETLRMVLRRREIARNANSTAFPDALRGCADFAELRRLVAQTSQTAMGCRLLSQYRTVLGEVLESTGCHGEHAGDALVLLNNVGQRLRAEGVDVGKQLCEVGLRLSCQLLQVPAASRYVRAAVEEGHAQSQKFISGLLKLCVPGLLRAMHTEEGAAASMPRTATRAELFALVTGRSCFQDAAQPSFSSLMGGLNIDASPDAYDAYVMLLGEVGALRLLWHEWPKAVTRKPPGSPARREQARAFAGAALRFAAYLRLRPFYAVSAVDRAYSAATGDCATDRSLDAESLSGLEMALRVERLSPTPLVTPLPAGLLDRTRDEGFVGEVAAALDSPDAEDALAALRRLVTDPRIDGWMGTRPEES